MATYVKDARLIRRLAEHRLDAQLTFPELAVRLNLGRSSVIRLIQYPHRRMFERTHRRITNYLKEVV